VNVIFWNKPLVVNIRSAITIFLGFIVLGCENQSNTPLSGKVQGMSMAPGFQEGDVISWQPRTTNNFCEMHQ
jgi:signal peptidase I